MVTHASYLTVPSLVAARLATRGAALWAVLAGGHSFLGGDSFTRSLKRGCFCYPRAPLP